MQSHALTQSFTIGSKRQALVSVTANKQSWRKSDAEGLIMGLKIIIDYQEEGNNWNWPRVACTDQVTSCRHLSKGDILKSLRDKARLEKTKKVDEPLEMNLLDMDSCMLPCDLYTDRQTEKCGCFA